MDLRAVHSLKDRQTTVGNTLSNGERSRHQTKAKRDRPPFAWWPGTLACVAVVDSRGRHHKLSARRTNLAPQESSIFCYIKPTHLRDSHSSSSPSPSSLQTHTVPTTTYSRSHPNPNHAIHNQLPRRRAHHAAQRPDGPRQPHRQPANGRVQSFCARGSCLPPSSASASGSTGRTDFLVPISLETLQRKLRHLHPVRRRLLRGVLLLRRDRDQECLPDDQQLWGP